MFFCLWCDVMGVQQAMVPVDGARSRDGAQRAEGCLRVLERFHADVAQWAKAGPRLDGRGKVDFVAQFSDGAYVVSERFHVVAAIGIQLMRAALRRGYPLRGGIGSGTFQHLESAVRADRDGTMWSVASFTGSAVIRAYQAAECRRVPGLRVLVHPHVLRHTAEPYVSGLTIPLASPQAAASYELRVVDTGEWKAARPLVERLQKAAETKRARRHYPATKRAYAAMSGWRGSRLTIFGPRLEEQ